MPLVRASTISGRITDINGAPLAGVIVEALRSGYGSTGRIALRTAYWARTDDRGEYRLYWVTPGKYTISAHKPATNSTRTRFLTANPNVDPPRLGFVATFYPGGSNPADAVPVIVEAAEEASGVSFRIEELVPVRVSGEVLTGMGMPTRVLVRMSPIAEEVSFVRNTYEGNTDAEGRFSFDGVLPGTYLLRATSPNLDEAAASIFTVYADMANLRLILDTGAEIPGQIYVEDPEAEGGVRLPAFPTGRSGLRVRLRELAVVPTGAPISPPAVDGVFTNERVTSGEYWVDVRPLPPGAYVKRVLYDGVEVPASGFIVDRQRPGRMDILLSLSAGGVEGVVTDSDGVGDAGMTVSLVPADARLRPRGTHTTTTAGEGRFSLEGVAPGEYLLFAWEYVEQNAYLNEDFMRPFLDRGQEVRVEEGLVIETEITGIGPVP